jgi:SNF2 family DNA or RNA helicase
VAHADVLNGEIIVQTHWNEKELVKQLPGARWDNDARAWKLPLSWAAGVQLRGVFGTQVTYGEQLQTWAAEERGLRVDPANALRDLTEPARPFEHLHDELYPFQRAGVQFLDAASSALLADEMGTGKTIQLLEQLFAGEALLPALVICPNGVKLNWAREAARWCPFAIVYTVAGSATERKKILERARNDPNALVIVNYEALRAHSKLAPFGSQRLARCPDCDGHDPKTTPQRCEVHDRELNRIAFSTVIVDEAHRIKDPNAKQTRAAWALGAGSSVERRYALTGTPIANDPSELWSIMHFVAPNEYPRKTAFVDRYCLLSWGDYGGLDVKGIHPRTRDEFFRILDPRFRRMPKALVLPQLPPKIRSTRYLDLPPRQLRAYREIEKGLVTRLDDGTLMVAKNDLEAKIRLLQFSSASMRTTVDGYRMCDPSPKVDELVEILDELAPKPVAVCAEHRQLIDLAAARLAKLGVSYGLITGGQREFEREVALRDFQAGKLRVMLFTVKAGGTGLTMTATDTLVFLQRSWSMIDNRQSEDRVHRIGSEQHEAIHFIDLVSRGTIEEDQIARLHEKMLRLEEITRDRARLAAAGLSTEDLDLAEVKLMEEPL